MTAAEKARKKAMKNDASQRKAAKKRIKAFRGTSKLRRK